MIHAFEKFLTNILQATALDALKKPIATGADIQQTLLNVVAQKAKSEMASQVADALPNLVKQFQAGSQHANPAVPLEAPSTTDTTQTAASEVAPSAH